MTTILLGRRLYEYNTPGSMGVVTDTHFIRCFWPHFKEPTKLFADGSSGIIVQGPPYPVNVLFPADTLFPDVISDADNLAVEAAMNAANGSRRGLVNPTPEMIEAYLSTYQVEAAKVPPTGTKLKCPNPFMLFKTEGKEDFLTIISKEDGEALANGEKTRSEIDGTVQYVKTTESFGDPTAEKYVVDGSGKLIKEGPK